MDIIRIGRASDNDVVFVKEEVSRYHCELFSSDGRVHIRDLGSTNGTWVNGRAITSSLWLKKGDKVMLGNKVEVNWHSLWTRFFNYPIISDTVSEIIRKELYVGREEGLNDIVINDAKITRKHHCKCILRDDGVITILDLGSTNGVYVDDIRITEETAFEDVSQVKIGDAIFTGGEIREWFGEIAYSGAAKGEMIKRKYEELSKCYKEKLNELLKAAEIHNEPFVLQFPSDDIKVEYYIREYDKQMSKILTMLGLISKSSRKDAIAIRDDMDLLAILGKEAQDEQREQCIEYRERVFDLVNSMQRDTMQKVKTVFDNLNEYYQEIFSSFYETTSTQSSIWKSMDNKRIIALPYLLYGFKDITFQLFEDSFQLQLFQFLPFLNHKNTILRYNSDASKTAQDVVNGLLGRMLAGSQSGNVQICVFDPKDLGGTSNVLKMLDRHVYTICARTSDMQAQLSMYDRYVEDVVQNLLQGPYTSLAVFNKGKEKQEPYQIVVLKDFPYGITPDMAHTILRIISNGIRAGVQFIFMINEDVLKLSEEYEKIGVIMRLNETSALQATEIDLTKEPDNLREKQQYALLNDNLLLEIVQHINAGFEVKTEEILRLTDYMIPKEIWWTGQSASRADIPFGMANNKQIQKINFTQESGQNAAVVIGIPGSGKSVFLHALITSAAINYSPRELQMYLLDFSGVEFNVYARHNLPHARVIAPEAEREFGLSILREVFEEGARRMALCREKGVTNIVELKRKNPELVVPRLLVIIDEFQKIFEIENDNISKDANAKIHAIIQEYRKFGINLILATQKLPSKSIVPYDLIANRVVFKSDPNDFSNLIKWPHSIPQPRLQTGSCIYNNESGAEVANYVARSFYINASKELEDLLDEIADFANAHTDMMDDHELRTFRSDELPEFSERIVSGRHFEPQDMPREVGVYVGESIAIAPCHVYMPLTKDSNNNILIIGGVPNIAKGIAYHTLLSEIVVHTEKAANVILMNFMMEDDPMQNMFQSEMFASISEYCNIQEVHSSDDVKDYLQFVKDEVVDARKSDPSKPMTHFFINIFEFQRGRVFDGVGSRGDMQSECTRLLEYILKNGPMVGVFTTLQVDNLANLNKIGYNTQNLFCHRIALQMSEPDSDKIVGNSAANKLLMLNRPATNYRALYYNHVNNSIFKFKPYRV